VAGALDIPLEELAEPGSVSRWQVSHLFLGEIEPDSGVGLGHGADGDGYFPAPPKMPLLEQHVSHPAIARANDETLHPPDLAIDGMDSVAGSHLCLTDRDNVFDYRPRMFGHGADADELGGAADGGVCGVAGALFQEAADEIIVTGHRALDQVDLLGVVELVELRECTAQPDFAG